MTHLSDRDEVEMHPRTSIGTLDPLLAGQVRNQETGETVAIGDRFRRGDMTLEVYALGEKYDWRKSEPEPIAYVRRNTSRREQGILVRRLLKAPYQRVAHAYPR